MNTSRFVGSVLVRAATVVLAAACFAAAIFLRRGAFPETRGIALIVTVLVGILTAIGFIHSFQGVYSRWMRLTRKLHTVAVTVLFGACYLLVVPVFWLLTLPFDLLKLRRRAEAESCWVERPHAEFDPESLERMG